MLNKYTMALRLNMGMGERWGASRDRLRDHGCTGRDRQDSSHYLLLLLLLSYFSHIWPCATHRWQSTRLLHPWDSQGKNPGVGCHFFLQCMKMKSESEVTQSCPTLSDPMDCSLPGSSVPWIFQARLLKRDAIAFSASNYLVVFKSYNLMFGRF